MDFTIEVLPPKITTCTHTRKHEIALRILAEGCRCAGVQNQVQNQELL
jgi:hypothetical protein